MLYGLGGWSEVLFHDINSSTSEVLASLVKFLALASSCWITPLVLFALWLCV